jgi:hypothetical protein
MFNPLTCDTFWYELYSWKSVSQFVFDNAVRIIAELGSLVFALYRSSLFLGGRNMSMPESSKPWLRETSHHIAGHVIGGILIALLTLTFSNLVLKSSPQVLPRCDCRSMVQAV